MTNGLTWVLFASFVVLSKTQENSTTDDWCPGYMCPLKNFTDFEICVEDYHMCNGVEDCDDGSDELTEEECERLCPDMWCASEKMCISEDWICYGWGGCSDDGFDGEPDNCEQICEDRDDHWCGDSDEETTTEYISNACISSVLVCNTFQDCRDNSDENECVG